MLILLSLMTALTLCGCKSADYERAAGLFRQAEPYRDASGRAEEAVQAGLEYRYQQAMALKDAGKTGEAALALYHLGDYRDARQQYFALYAAAHRCTLAAGEYHTVALRTDGTVAAAGYSADGRCAVSGWIDIVELAAGGSQGDAHTVDLRSDGTVVAVGNNAFGQCNVQNWTDIVEIASGSHIVGLKSDGTLHSTGNNYNGEGEVADWTDIRLPIS